jgi:hypothetical protein
MRLLDVGLIDIGLEVHARDRFTQSDDCLQLPHRYGDVTLTTVPAVVTLIGRFLAILHVQVLDHLCGLSSQSRSRQALGVLDIGSKHLEI